MNTIAHIPQELLTAFWRYERALMNNDAVVMDELFADSPHTIRSDSGVSLTGHTHISAFRAQRPKPPQRWVEQIYVNMLAPSVASVVAHARRKDGSRTAQTQMWQLINGAWKVVTAHVSAAPPEETAELDPYDPRIWRIAPGSAVLPAQSLPVHDVPGQDAGAAPHAGELAGLTYAVKDLFAVAGQKIGAGNPAWLRDAPLEKTNSAAVAALQAHGAQIAGIAHTDELAFSLAGANIHYGTPPNPIAPGHIPGGSTSGPAVAVAAGLVDFGLGTDTAGSIRVPASYCGLFGLRTTHGAISRDGLVGLAESFDTVGVVAGKAETLARVNDVLLPSAVTHRVEHIVVIPALLELLQDDARVAFEAGLLALSLRMDVPVRELSSHESFASQDLEEWFTAFRTVQSAEAWRMHGVFATSSDANLEPAIIDRFRFGASITSEQEAAARAVLESARSRLVRLLPLGTVLGLPSSASGAPRINASAHEIEESRAATLRLTCLASLAGLPALSAPLLSIGTLPLGLCLVAAPSEDRTLLEFATDPRFNSTSQPE